MTERNLDVFAQQGREQDLEARPSVRTPRHRGCSSTQRWCRRGAQPQESRGLHHAQARPPAHPTAEQGGQQELDGAEGRVNPRLIAPAQSRAALVLPGSVALALLACRISTFQMTYMWNVAILET
jgi:hypothetical protein